MNSEQIELLRHVSRKLIRELGLLQLNKLGANETPGHWHALIEISKDPGITISKLGGLLIMSPSRISRLVKALGKEGFIELKSGNDKREKYLYLTNDGNAAIEKNDSFSRTKIYGALEFLAEKEMLKIIDSIGKYSKALEQSRLMKEQVKIHTLSTSRALRKKIMDMIINIQKNEFEIPVSDEINICILKAEQSFYYNNSYNFWYVTDNNGKIIGSIGLKKIDDNCAEIKKFFVIPKYRGKGVAQKLMNSLLKAAMKHKFKTIFLGTVDKLEAAAKFYKKYGFLSINRQDLPNNFELCYLDTLFFRGNVEEMVLTLT